MEKSIGLLSENEKKFLRVLLNKGNLGDSQISKITGLSKATIGRIRKNLESDFISEYLPIIKLEKVGIEIFATLLFEWKGFQKKELTKKVFSKLQNDPRTIFMASGQGSDNLSMVLYLGFRNIDEYHKYFKSFREEYSNYVGKVVTLTLPSKEIIKHDFTDIIKHSIVGGEKHDNL